MDVRVFKNATTTQLYNRAAQCIDKEILIRKIYDIGIDIDKENFEKLIRY